MTIDDFAKLAGVLGFVISLATFALTRWERRVLLDFGLNAGVSTDFDDSSADPKGTANLTITNLGTRSALLNLRTVELRSGSNLLHAWRQDHWGSQQREVLLKPSDSHTIGIPLETFASELQIKPPAKYDDKSFYFMHPVRVSVATTDGKVHASKKLKYWEATGEFHRA